MVVSIRQRERYQSSPRRGLKPEWTEYQVVHKGSILYRGDTFEEAQDWCAKNGHAYPDRPTRG